MAELKIEIIEDINGIIVADKIAVERVEINRGDVDAKRARIAELESQIASATAEIEALKAEIAGDEEIIAIADAQKESEVQVTEEIAGEETLAEEVEVAEGIEPQVEKTEVAQDEFGIPLA